MKDGLQVGVSRIMKYRDVGTKELADKTGLAYNTVLAYRRDSMSQINKQTLESMAEVLDVFPWEFFYTGMFSKVIGKIARAVGLLVSDPVTAEECKVVLAQIGEKVGAEIVEDDFAVTESVVDWV